MSRTVVAVVLLVTALAAAAAPAAGQGDAQHSLRSPVTDERFYFVMADRFENGE